MPTMPELRHPILPPVAATGWRRIAAHAEGMPLALFFSWVLYSAYVFLHVTAQVHDEIDFLVLADAIPLRDMVGAEPPALYGSLFWVALKLAGSAFAARCVVLVMFVLTPWLLMRTIHGARMRVAVFLLWLSMPIAWWSGKLIAPEIPVMFMVALALYLFHRQRLPAVAVALAAAVALKISALPAVIFFVIAYALQTGVPLRTKLRTAPLLAAVFVLALFVLCPPILAIVSELGKQPSHLAAASFLAQARESLLSYRWEWDAVFSGGVLRFSLMPVALALVAVGVLARDWRMFVGVFVTACMFLLMSVNSASAYGWYWTGLFPILLYAASRTPAGMATDAWPWPAFLCFAAACNGVQQLPLIVDQAYQRFEHIRVLGKRDEILACVNRKLDEIKPVAVHDQSEFGLKLTRDVPVYVTPAPQAVPADVLLLGTRMLVGRRFPDAPWAGPTHLYATCDAVLIFTTR
jgi:hypothetical protein